MQAPRFLSLADMDCNGKGFDSRLLSFPGSHVLEAKFRFAWGRNVEYELPDSTAADSSWMARNVIVRFQGERLALQIADVPSITRGWIFRQIDPDLCPHGHFDFCVIVFFGENGIRHVPYISTPHIMASIPT